MAASRFLRDDRRLLQASLRTTDGSSRPRQNNEVEAGRIEPGSLSSVGKRAHPGMDGPSGLAWTIDPRPGQPQGRQPGR